MPKRNIEHKDVGQDAQAMAGDDFDKDLERDNRRDSGGSTMADLANRGDVDGDAAAPISASGSRTDRGEFPQHARRGQAQSPVEETPNQPERKREGHPGGARVWPLFGHGDQPRRGYLVRKRLWHIALHSAARAARPSL